MAVRISGSGQQFSSTSGLPASALFTVTCWVQLLATKPDDGSVFWMMSSSSTQFCYLGTPQNSSQVLFDWSSSGSSNTLGPINTLNIWFKTAVVVNGTSATLYINSTPTAALVTYAGQANFALPTGTLTFTVGPGTSFATKWADARIAAIKVWDAALTKAECEQELQSYVPQRTANLNRWHPMVRAETTDYGGADRTLSGGTGAVTESGPPIAWTRLRVPVLPWDPTTTVWYAHYDTTSGELLSLGTVPPSPIPPGTALLDLLGQPDLSRYEWSTSARAFILKEGVIAVDRVADLVADGSLASVWSTLGPSDEEALQSRVGQMLGPHRTRLDFQSPDLE